MRNQLQLIRKTARRFVLGMRTRTREILLAAAPAIAVATVVRVMMPFVGRMIYARGTWVGSRQLISVELVFNILIFFTSCFAIAAFVHIARSETGAQAAYRRLSPITFALFRLVLMLGTIWIVAFGLQFWMAHGAPRLRPFLQTAGRDTWEAVLIGFICVFVGLLLSVPALADRAIGAGGALRSATRLLPRALLGCALLVLIFDVGANALIGWTVRGASSVMAHGANAGSALPLFALLGYICAQVVRYIGFYALVCLYLAASEGKGATG